MGGGWKHVEGGGGRAVWWRLRTSAAPLSCETNHSHASLDVASAAAMVGSSPCAHECSVCTAYSLVTERLSLAMVASSSSGGTPPAAASAPCESGSCASEQSARAACV